MKIPKRLFPVEYIHKENKITAQTESLPFYIKECGYGNERKFSLGNENNYSEYLLLYSISGVVRFTKNQNTQYVHQDNIIVSACNTPLTFTRTTKDWTFFYIVICGSHAKKYYNLIRTPSCVLPASPLNHTLDYFIEAVSLNFKKEVYTDMQASLIVHNILFELYRISYNVLKAKAIIPVQETIVNQALRYISVHYKKDLDIDTICNEVNFSKYYFCKIFKEHTGITIHQYVNEFRVNKSKELLSYSKLSINAISTNVGFKNTLTYSRAFKNSMHMTPSEYRKNF
ncbi:MAG: AraC family transcriptional regulator [Lachnospiraceae bacterium]